MENKLALKKKIALFWAVLKPKIVPWLKSQVVTQAIKKILGTKLAVGFKGWLIKYIIENLFDEVAKPMIEAIIRKGELIYDNKKGEIQIKRLKNAKDVDDYNTIIGDILC